LILSAYKCEEALTSIEIYDKKTQEVYDLMKALEDYFLIDSIPDPDTKSSKFFGQVLISRFSTVFEVAVTYMKKCKGRIDEYADLFGIFFAYPPLEVAKFCSKKRMKDLNLLL